MLLWFDTVSILEVVSFASRQTITRMPGSQLSKLLHVQVPVTHNYTKRNRGKLYFENRRRLHGQNAYEKTDLQLTSLLCNLIPVMSFEKDPSPEPQPRAQKSQADIDAFFARIDVLRAENEAQGRALVRSWMTPETRTKYDLLQKRSAADLEAEDLRLFKPQPSYLGVGAVVPADFLASESQSGDKRLRQKLLPSRELKASKRRSEEEKEASRKRAKGRESSEEEEGRSALGKKKRKVEKNTERPPSAVNPLITNGLLQTGEQGRESSDIAAIDLAADNDGQHDQDDGDLGDGETKRRKKKRKKSRHQSLAEDGVDGGIEETTRGGPAAIKDAARVPKSPSDLVMAQIDETKVNVKSKEDRKAEKKARKEERRRLKAQA